MAIVKLNNDLKELYVQEQDEIRKILASLSEEAAQYIEEIRTDYRSLTDLDFIFARGALALTMRASRPILNEEDVSVSGKDATLFSTRRKLSRSPYLSAMNFLFSSSPDLIQAERPSL